MKLIISYIKPERLNAVKQELYKRNIFKMSVSNALGCGQQKGYVSAYRGAISEVNLLRKVRVAIAVNDEYVQPTIDGIIAGARTGHIGDGKIFVLYKIFLLRGFYLCIAGTPTFLPASALSAEVPDHNWGLFPYVLC